MKLHQLPTVADETLGGLIAGPALLNRAKAQAGQGHSTKPALGRRRALAMALSLVLVVGVGYLALQDRPQPAIPQVHTMAAGNQTLPQGARTAGDLPRGSLTLSQAKVPAYQGVWASGSGANFPLIRVDGRYYRLLTHPEDVSAIAGQQVGQVGTFALEPALDNSSGILSNIVPVDAPVYQVNGMGNAVLAAQVNGSLRLFQRVAFAGNGLLGGETLGDSLPVGAVALQLTGVGTVHETGDVKQLMDNLFGQSVYLGSHSRRGDQALLMQYDNGVVLQLAVSGEELSGAGTFSNPGFIQLFKEKAQ